MTAYTDFNGHSLWLVKRNKELLTICTLLLISFYKTILLQLSKSPCNSLSFSKAIKDNYSTFFPRSFPVALLLVPLSEKTASATWLPGAARLLSKPKQSKQIGCINKKKSTGAQTLTQHWHSPLSDWMCIHSCLHPLCLFHKQGPFPFAV